MKPENVNTPEVVAGDGSSPSPCSASSVMKQGGAWLAAVRAWIQWNAVNGEHVHWGSDDVVRADFTVRKLEEMAAAIVAAERNERNRPNDKTQAPT